MDSPFSEARERVSAQEAARYYGAEFDRRGWALCPFHRDTHPSMSFKDGHYHCWVCDVSGDSVDYVARLMDLRPLEALRRINEDFGLGLAIDRPPTARERQKAARGREMADIYSQFTRWRSELAVKLATCLRTAHLAMLQLQAPEDMGRLTPAQATAIQRREALEYWADCLSWGSLEEQMDIFRERKGIDQLCERILRDTPAR